jgi:putative ABC transport system permease protein
MFRFAPYVLKSLWRHRTRSLLTAGGAAAALFVFCAVGAVQQGMNGLVRGPAERALVVFQANRFCPATSRLPEDYARQVARLGGVRGVLPIQVFLNNCRASLDLVVFHGVPADQLRTARDLRLTAGAWDDFARRRDAALVGAALARRRGLAVGRPFSIGEVTVHVAGVYAAPNAAEESFVYTHLDFLQRTPGLNAVGTVTQLEVLLDDNADPDTLCRSIDALFRAGPVATDTRPKGVFQAGALGDLAELVGFANYLAWASVGLVLALVAATAVMGVQDRIREHAVLQVLGVSGPRVFRLVLAESVLLSLLGGILGVGAATALLAWGGFALGAEGVTVAFTPSARLAAVGLAVAAATGFLAGLAPAWQAARADIVPSLRQV